MTGLPWRSWAALAVAAAVVLGSAWPTAAVFIGRLPLVAVSAGVAGAVVVSLVLWRLRFSGAPVVFVHAIGALAVGAVVLFHPLEAGPGVLADAWTGATGGWLDLLRRRLPTEALGTLVMPLVVLAWTVTALVAETVLRAERRSVALIPLSLAPPTFLLLGTGPTRRPALALALAALVILFLWLVAGGEEATRAETGAAPDRGTTMRATAVAVGVAGLALGVGAAGSATLISDADRWDPRRDLEPPVEERSQPSPLTQLKAQLIAQPPRPLFTVQLDPPGGDAAAVSPPDGQIYFRTAALEAYDGVLWRSDSAFTVVGSVLDPEEDRDRGLVTMRVETSTDYSSQFLPVMDHPVDIDQADVGYSPETDTLVVRQRAANLTYTTRISPRTVSDDDIRRAKASPELDSLFVDFTRRADPLDLGVNGDRLALDLDLQPLLAELDRRGGLAGAPGTGQRLLELRDRLTDGFRYSTNAPSGHSLAALEQYYRPSAPPTSFPSAVGYAEQGAALFALLARADGFPARVAVGYRVPTAGPGAPLTVTEAEAWAWVEVSLDGLGWVRIEATPTDEAKDVEAAPPPEVVPAPDDGSASEIPTSTARRPSGQQVGETSRLPWLVLPAVLLTGLTPLAIKAVRRWRRLRTNDPAVAVTRRWLEARDRLRDLGVPVTAACTPGEVVGLALATGLLDEGTAARTLAQKTSTALYEPERVGDGDVEHAAALAREIRRELRSQVPWHRRLRGQLGFRSLRRLPRGGTVPPLVYAEQVEEAASAPAVADQPGPGPDDQPVTAGDRRGRAR